MVELCNALQAFDHCRIGSLEKLIVIHVKEVKDHCRIGSLETDVVFVEFM